MHKRRFFWFIYLAFCLALYISFDSWICFYLLIVMLFLPLVSVLCSLPFVSRRKLRESHPERTTRLKRSFVSFRISGKKNNPLPCRVDFVVKDLMGGAEKKKSLTLFSGEALDFELDSSHCGRLEFEVTRAAFTDFLGLFSFRVRIPDKFFVSVDPISTRPDPEPDFSHFVSLRFHPRRGGGFSENHELKEYTPGDPLNTIHWKLSAKTDKTIVREPQDQEESRVYLTLDRTRDRREMDNALGCLVWVGESLLKRSIPFSVCCRLDGERVSCLPVDSPAGLTALLDQIMSSVPVEGLTSLVKYQIPGATWRFHVNPKKEEADV